MAVNLVQKGKFMIRKKRRDNTQMNGVVLILDHKIYKSTLENRATEFVIILHIDSKIENDTEQYYREMNEAGNGWEDYFKSPDGEMFVLYNYSQDKMLGVLPLSKAEQRRREDNFTKARQQFTTNALRQKSKRTKQKSKRTKQKKNVKSKRTKQKKNVNNLNF